VIGFENSLDPDRHQLQFATSQEATLLSNNQKLAEKLEQLEQKYDKEIADIFTVIKHLVAGDARPKEKMGFNVK